MKDKNSIYEKIRAAEQELAALDANRTALKVRIEQLQSLKQSIADERVKLTLSERIRRELEIKQKIETERKKDSNPLELKPNFMGIGIDLRKASKWLKSKFNLDKSGKKGK